MSKLIIPFKYYHHLIPATVRDRLRFFGYDRLGLTGMALHYVRSKAPNVRAYLTNSNFDMYWDNVLNSLCDFPDPIENGRTKEEIRSLLEAVIPAIKLDLEPYLTYDITNIEMFRHDILITVHNPGTSRNKSSNQHTSHYRLNTCVV